MPSEKDNTLEFNPYVKSDKIPYIIYADVKFKKIDDCANNPYNYSTKKLEGIFFVDIQCHLYGILIIYKTSILYIMGKIL